jgi:hypothetical protein
MITTPFHKCYAFVFAALIFASGCCCKNYTQPYTVPPQTQGPFPADKVYAGAARIEITSQNGNLLPEWDGVPLAGVMGGRLIGFMDLNPFNYHTFLKPSQGIKDSHFPLYARSLVIDNGSERVCIVTVDIAITCGELVELAHRKAAARGFSIPIEKVLVCASHTHSGPGAMTNKRLWEYSAYDRCVNRVREELARKMADSMIEAEQNMVEVQIGTATSSLQNLTYNRIADDGCSPSFGLDHVDKQLGVIRIDKKDGTALATVWNYAIHGIYYLDENLEYSPDVMGASNLVELEQTEGGVGGIALFINGSVGDINPKSNDFTIDHIRNELRDAIVQTRASIDPNNMYPNTTHPQLELKTAYKIVNLGTPQLDVTAQRLVCYTSEFTGELDIREFMEQENINPGGIFTMSTKWVENEVRFQAIRIDKTLLSSVPGEPIHDIGLGIRSEALLMGYDKVFICSLANNQMGYVTTEEQYNFGGYQALVTLFGPTTGQRVIEACKTVANAIRP